MQSKINNSIKKMSWLIGLVVIVMFGTSCDKESTPQPSVKEKLPELAKTNTTKKNQMIQDFAMMLANSLKDNEVRKLIKAEALLMYDGDYDILANSFQDKTLGESNVKLKNHLVNSYYSLFNSSRTNKTSGDNFLDELYDSIPTLQISVPVNCEIWDEENYIPLVVFLPYDFDDSKTETVPAFDQNGGIIHLSLKQEPEFPVIVLGKSERIYTISHDEKQLNDPIFQNQNYDFYLIPIVDSNFETSNSETENINTTSARITSLCTGDRNIKNGKDQLLKAKFVSEDKLREVEPWVSGKPEIKVDICYTNIVNNYATPASFQFDISEDGWYTKNLVGGIKSLNWKNINKEVFVWDKKYYGYNMSYIFTEEDGYNNGWLESHFFRQEYDSEDYSSTYFTATASVFRYSGDDSAGSAIVKFCDNTDGDGTLYSTGYIKFYVNQK